MAKLDREDFKQLADTIIEALRPIAEQVSQREAQNITYRVLDAEDGDLRQRIEGIIRKTVTEEVEKHVVIRVGWKSDV